MTKCLALPLVALAVTALACRSGIDLERQVLPFHVAVVPPPPATPGSASPGELPGVESELRLALASDAVVRAVSEALGEYCFARVSLLELTADDGRDAFARQAALYEEAVDRGADLVVEYVLRFDEEINRTPSSTAWLNYPLFLFAGPSHWFVADQTYFADVELTASVYDVQALAAGDRSLGDPTALVLLTVARFSEADLDFTDRADGLSDFAKGILVPSAWLARNTQQAGEEVEAAVVSALRTRIVQNVQSRRDELVRAPAVAPAFLEPSEVTIAADGDELVVSGTVHLRADGLARRVHAVRLDAGAGRVDVEPGPPVGDAVDGYRLVPFEVRVPRDSAARYLRAEVVVGARDRFVRTYTFPL